MWYLTNNSHATLGHNQDIDCMFLAVFSWGKAIHSRLIREHFQQCRRNPDRRVPRQRTGAEADDQEEDDQSTFFLQHMRGKRERPLLPYPLPTAEADADPKRAMTDFECWSRARMVDMNWQDLGLSTTDYGWHSPMLVTLREWCEKNQRQRSSEALKRRNETKAEKREKRKADKRLMRQQLSRDEVRMIRKRPAAAADDGDEEARLEREAQRAVRRQRVSPYYQAGKFEPVEDDA